MTLFFGGLEVGVFLSVLAAFVGCASRKRLRATARFLAAFADVWEGKRAAKVDHSPGPAELPTVALEVISALVNQGEREKVAERAVRATVMSSPQWATCGSFDVMYKEALRWLPQARSRA